MALVSSGDAGIYGLAALVFELLDREAKPEWRTIDLIVVPGDLRAAGRRLPGPARRSATISARSRCRIC